MGHPKRLGFPALLWGMVARSPSFWRLHAMAPTLQAVWDAAPTSFFMTFKFHGIIRRWKGSCHARLYQIIVPVWHMKRHWTDMIERVSCSLHHLVPLEKLRTRKQRGQLDAEMVKANRCWAISRIKNRISWYSVYFHISWLRLKRYMAFWVLALERCTSQSSCQDGIKSEDLPQVDDQTPSATWICVWQTSQSQICHHADPRGSWRGSWGRQRRSMGQAPLLHHVHLVCVCSEVI